MRQFDQRSDWTKRLNSTLIRAGSVLVLSIGMLPNVAAAAELLMFERAGCSWCKRWDREVGMIYPNTKEGQRAWLRRVDLDRPMPTDFTLNEPVRYTPTFVLTDNGREIGRLNGYINDESFWGLLGSLLERLDGGRR